jgi:hypothetical protein
LWPEKTSPAPSLPPVQFEPTWRRPRARASHSLSVTRCLPAFAQAVLASVQEMFVQGIPDAVETALSPLFFASYFMTQNAGTGVPSGSVPGGTGTQPGEQLEVAGTQWPSCAA